MSWGETSGCDTFVYDPGKQSANDFQHDWEWQPFLKDCRYMEAVRSPLKRCYNLITPVLFCLPTLVWPLRLVLHRVLLLSTVT